MSIETLQKYFCASESDPRHYLHAPSHYKGRICATNGHWFAVLPAGTPIPAKMQALEGYDPTAFIAACDNPDDPQTIWIPAKDVGITPADTCGMCEGKRSVSLRDCDVCGGAGDFIMGTHTYECAECGGTGDITAPGGGIVCPDCDGRGLTCPSPYSPSTLGKPLRSPSGYYIQRLRELGGDISAEPVTVGRHSDCYLIRFIGGHGLLMPITASPLPLSQSDLAQGATA